jgi:hypothetical protein
MSDRFRKPRAHAPRAAASEPPMTAGARKKHSAAIRRHNAALARQEAWGEGGCGRRRNARCASLWRAFSNRHMQSAPNKTIVIGRFRAYRPAADGYGGEVEIEVVRNISPDSERDFLKHGPGDALLAFTPEPKIPVGDAEVTAELTFLGGPRGGRAVLQSFK